MEKTQKYAKPELIKRPHIETLLTQGIKTNFIHITAPPGYGKTSSVSFLNKNNQLRVIWLTCLKRDNDYVHFWNSLIKAMVPCAPDLAKKMKDTGIPNTLSKYRALLNDFADEVYKGQQVVFVADNFNRLHNSEICIFFEELIALELENFCLILICSSRNDLLTKQAMRKSVGYMISTDDLKFSKAETEQFFNLNQVKLAPFDLEAIYEKTAGWPLALYHICQQYIKNNAVYTSESTTAIIPELFESDYFLNYDREFQKLLIKTSMLPEFSFDIINDIHNQDPQEAVKQMMSNTFISYNFSSQVVNFHKMYKEFLSLKTFMLTQEEIRQTFFTAGEWFESKKLYVEAIECFYRCKNYDKMLNSIFQLLRVRITSGLNMQILEYLNKLPDDYVNVNATALFCKAFIYLNQREIKPAKRILTQLDETLKLQQDTELNRSLLGEIHIALADICLLENKDAFLTHFKTANLYVPEGSHIQNVNLVTLNNAAAFFLPDTAPGALEHIKSCIFEGAVYVEKLLNGRGFGYEWLFSSEASFYRGDIQEAIENCYKAIYKAAEHKQHDIVLNAYFILMRTALYQGDPKQVHSYLNTVTEYYETHPHENLLEIKDFIFCWFYMAVKDPDSIPAWVKDYYKINNKLFPFSFGRNKLLYVFYLYVSEKYQEAAAYLTQMEKIFLDLGLWALKLEHYILKAICFFKLGNKKESVDSFQKAYLMAYHNGIIVPFIEYGTNMAEVVRALKQDHPQQFDELWLSTLLELSIDFTKKISIISKNYNQKYKVTSLPHIRLTKRESDILNCLSQGMTREEISDLYKISINGVKKHITGIYNKLGAINCADAIRIALTSGLISDNAVSEY